MLSRRDPALRALDRALSKLEDAARRVGLADVVAVGRSADGGSPASAETMTPTPAYARKRHGVRGIVKPWLRRVTMCSCGACDDCRARRRLWLALRDVGSRVGDGRLAFRLARRRFRPRSDERPRCGARCRDGHACRAPAVWVAGELVPRNGRCRVHGGLSTGPRTAEGKARALAALAKVNAARRAATKGRER